MTAEDGGMFLNGVRGGAGELVPVHSLTKRSYDFTGFDFFKILDSVVGPKTLPTNFAIAGTILTAQVGAYVVLGKRRGSFDTKMSKSDDFLFIFLFEGILESSSGPNFLCTIWVLHIDCSTAAIPRRLLSN